ncbi:MAG: class I SAM-dependent methyltransferase, partial [Ginsengibacter sp.]
FLPVNNKIFMRFGLLPVRDHYYQPLINPRKHLKKSLREDRHLPGINLNIDEQLSILNAFDFNQELEQFPLQKINDLEYYFKNGSFESGDGEFLYNMIRLKKPSKFVEIGSGFSTLMANSAIRKNNNDCKHICIEPYEVEWIKKLNVEVITKKVEDVNMEIFLSLQKNDILFIDSSHIIRPQGDVLTEYLEILPQLKPGVIVHVHDIFTPKDYLDEFVFTNHYMWNEQYLLEALLSNTQSFKIIGAVNFLKHHYFNKLAEKSPALKEQPNREPGSFWMVKT